MPVSYCHNNKRSLYFLRFCEAKPLFNFFVSCACLLTTLKYIIWSHSGYAVVFDGNLIEPIRTLKGYLSKTY